MEKKYRTFHGHKSRWEQDVNFHVPKGFVVLGRANAVEYLCDKKHGGGDGKRAIYRHKFESEAYVLADEKMGGQLYIVGNDIRVTRCGIEN